MEEKNNYRLKVIILLVFAAFLTCSVLFVWYVIKQNEEANKEYLYSVTKQKASAIENQINKEWEILEGVAICIAHLEELTNIDYFMPALEKINSENTFLKMGFISKDGFGNMVDLNGEIYKNIDFSNEAFFIQAMNGEYSVSDICKDQITNEGFVIYLAVPVKRGGDIIGILCGVNSSEAINEILSFSIYGTSGDSFILSGKGSELQLSSGTSIRRDIADVLGADASKKIREAVESGKEQFVSYGSDREKMWAEWIPVEMNSWSVLGVISKSALNNNIRLILGIIFIVCFASFILISLLLHVNQVVMRNKKELEHLAYIDEVTGYMNYRKFILEAERLISNAADKNYAVWYCDIQKFKLLNDMLGYEIGDCVLKYMAVLIHKHSRAQELFCRVDADNFAGVLFYQKEEEAIERFHELEAEIEHYDFQGRGEYPLKISAGIYFPAQFEEKITVNEMVNRANIAQKLGEQSEERCIFYSDDIRREAVEEADLESRMRKALNDEEFELYIQPKTNIQQNNRIWGGEALARWNSKEKGMIGPGTFIPLFEKNGFIVELDRYMLVKLCSWMRDYFDRGGRIMRFSVNVSRLGLFREDFLSFYIGVKKEFRIPDGVLELEFTESVMITQANKFKKVIMELRKNGFICSMDDFGSGYSALNVLKDLPIQVLKLDMLFFKGADGRRSEVIVENILHMARQLNIQSVSEGVELVSQVKFLKEKGCELVQGYVFAKPMPLEAFMRLLEKYPEGIPLPGDTE